MLSYRAAVCTATFFDKQMLNSLGISEAAVYLTRANCATIEQNYFTETKIKVLAV